MLRARGDVRNDPANLRASPKNCERIELPKLTRQVQRSLGRRISMRATANIDGAICLHPVEPLLVTRCPAASGTVRAQRTDDSLPIRAAENAPRV